ncbi:MAG: hypothetical protein MI748_03850 [Opitutales bacterium]|nr:hypothetical protein [Opitutales bacterium]
MILKNHRSVSGEKTAVLYEAHLFSISVALVSLVLFSMLFYVVNIRLTPFHCLIFPLVSFLSFWGRVWSLRLALKHVSLQTLGLVLIGLFASWFYNLGGDGMGIHIEAIVGLESKWNPLKDPYFMEVDEYVEEFPEIRELTWAKKGVSITFSYLLSAIFNKGFSSHEAGKLINFIAIALSYLSSFLLCQKLSCRKFYQVVIPLVWAFNPVSVYQSLSYWQDSFVAGLFTSIIALTLYLAKNPKNLWIWLSYLAQALLLAGAKKAGIGFVILSTFFLVAYLLIFHFRIKTKLLILAAFAGFCSIVLGGAHLSGMWRFNKGVFGRIIQTVEHHNADHILYGGSSFNQVEDYQDLNRWSILFYSTFSRARPVAYEIELKWPFETSWDELKVFYYFFEDPRAGGFGPFWGTIVLLVLGAALVYWRRFKGNTSWLVLGLLLVFFPLLFLPTYWARWIPQVWLFPLLILLCLRSGGAAKKGFVRNSPILSLGQLKRIDLNDFAAVMCAVNCILILSLYVFGNWIGTSVIRKQLEIASKLEEPVSLGTGWFPSNRIWLIDKGIDYEIKWNVSPRIMQFYRTNTHVYISEEDYQFVDDDGKSIAQELSELKQFVQRWQKGQWLNEVYIHKGDG